MTTQAQEKVINGVNVAQIADTIKAVRNQPELADSKFRVTNTWISGGHNRIKVENFYSQRQEMAHQKEFVFEADEPPALAGEDNGANPVEFVLAALSACMTTTLVYYAAVAGYQLDSVESKYEGDIDLQGFLGLSQDIRKGYKQVRATFNVKGNIPREKIEEFVRCSPVYDIVTNPVPVAVKVNLVS